MTNTDNIDKSIFPYSDSELAEAEAGGELTTQQAARAAFARGKIAEESSRWKDAAKHYARAAGIDPCFETLIKAQKSAHHIGNNIHALHFAMEAKEAAITKYGENSPQHAYTLNSLGEVYQRKGEDKEAEAFYQQALKIHKNLLKKIHPDMADCHHNLGTVYFLRGHFGKAKKEFEKTLKIREKALNKNHPDITSILASLGVVCTRRKEYSEAESLLERSLEIHKNNSMEMHYFTALTYKGLAELCEIQERYKEAEQYCKKILLINQKYFGKEHHVTATSRFNLGEIYHKQKQYKKADLFCSKAISVLENFYKPDHPNIKLMKFYYDRLKAVIALNATKSQQHPTATGG